MRIIKALAKQAKAEAAQYGGMPQQAGWGPRELSQQSIGLGLGRPLPRGGEFEGQFGPMQPLIPMPIDRPGPGRERPEPRIWQYPVGYNLPTHPGDLKLVAFKDLRAYADIYDVARKCIEIRKAEIATLEWDIVVDDAWAGQVDPREADDYRRQLRAFFSRPDPNYYDLASWLKAIIEDFLVIDAVAIYPVPARGKGWLGSGISGLILIDGSTIKPLVDAQGGVPKPPAPAYQQYIWGVPRVELTALQGVHPELGEPDAEFAADQLLYLVMNPRSWTVYGFPPTEQAIVTIRTALRRMEWMLTYFEEGSVPAMWLYAPPGYTPAQAAQLEQVLNATIAASVGAKWKLRVLPAGTQVQEMRQPVLTDQFDRLMIEKTAMAYDVSLAELGFMPQSGLGGKGYGEQMFDIQQRKSLLPTVRYLETVFRRIMTDLLHVPEYLRFKFLGFDPVEDDLRRAQIDQIYVSLGVLSRDEVRERLGLPKLGSPLSEEPLLMTSAGPIPVAAAPEAPPAGEEKPSVEEELKALGSYLERRGYRPRRPFRSRVLAPAWVQVASRSPEAYKALSTLLRRTAQGRQQVEERMPGLAEQLVGRWKEGDLEGAMDLLEDAYADAYLDGAVIWGVDPDDVDLTQIRQDAESQRRHMADLLDDIASIGAGLLLVRASQYAGGLWQAWHQGLRDYAPTGTAWIWRTNSDDRVCDLCAGRDGQIYTDATLPGMPGDGGYGELCEGGPNCRCWLEPVPPVAEEEEA